MKATRIQLRTDCPPVVFECLAVEDGYVHHVLNLGVDLETCQGRVPGQ